MSRIGENCQNQAVLISLAPAELPASAQYQPSLFCWFLALLLLFAASRVDAQGKGGHWTFENSGEDIAIWDQSANNGLLQNQAAFSGNAPLQEGTAYLWLDSALTHNFFRVEDDSDLDFRDESVGISAWIYPIVLNDVHYIVNKGEQKKNPKTTNYALRISQGTNNLEFLIRDDNNQAQRVTSSFTIPRNQWTFVAAFYDVPAGKVYLWNDPHTAPVDTLDFTHSLVVNDEPLAIGSWFRDDLSVPTIKDFKGRIDDVRLSNDVNDILPIASALGDPDVLLPVGFSLDQNYPNPFNPTTIIAFNLPVASVVTLEIFNVMGQRVRTMVGNGRDRSLPPGTHNYIWNATDAAGNAVTSGIYFYRLSAGASTQTRKMMLVR